MNREFKFRAWDGEKIVESFIVARPQAADNLSIMTDEDFALEQYGCKEWKIMQFTGLKDKKGVEIWEGDIVKGGPYDFKPRKNKLSISTIVYRHNGFWVDNEGFGWEGEDLWDWDEIKVIGNIYENPELLKPKKDTHP